jgi:hypothetical protein
VVFFTQDLVFGAPDRTCQRGSCLGAPTLFLGPKQCRQLFGTSSVTAFWTPIPNNTPDAFWEPFWALHRRSQKTSRHMHASANLGCQASLSLIIGEFAPHPWSSQVRKVGERWLSGGRWHFLPRIWCPALSIEPRRRGSSSGAPALFLGPKRCWRLFGTAGVTAFWTPIPNNTPNAF